MDLDSDYCSIDSDGIQSSSRTPTPPHLKSFKCSNNLTNEIIIKNNTKNLKPDLKNGQGDDVVFLLGKSEKRVEVHNVNAIAWRPPFLKSKVLAAVDSEDVSEIRIAEWEPEVFRVFLKYLETGECEESEVSPTNYLELVQLCRAYDVVKLLRIVTSFVDKKLTVANCVELYKFGATKDVDEIRAAAFAFFLRSGNALLEHESFLELDPVTLSILVSSDDFAIRHEVLLFTRLKAWVTQQCKRLNYPADRKEFFGRVAGLLFNHIRYPLINPMEFKSVVVPSGLLSEKDIKHVNDRHKLHPAMWHTLPPAKFVDRPRLSKLLFSVPLYNNVQFGFRKIAGETPTVKECVRFIVSHDIYLTGVGFFGPAQSINGRCSPETKYNIKILVEGDYTKYHCRCPAQNATITTSENFSIDLTQPLKIKRLEPQKLIVSIDGELTQFGVWALPQAAVLVQHKGELITFHFGDADADPQPVLESSGAPSSSTPTLVHHHHHHNYYNRQQLKAEPRNSGVIRCISFVLRN